MAAILFLAPRFLSLFYVFDGHKGDKGHVLATHRGRPGDRRLAGREEALKRQNGRGRYALAVRFNDLF